MKGKESCMWNGTERNLPGEGRKEAYRGLVGVVSVGQRKRRGKEKGKRWKYECGTTNQKLHNHAWYSTVAAVQSLLVTPTNGGAGV